MPVYTEELTIRTKGPFDIVNITGLVEEVVKRSGIRNGLVHVFAPHATGVLALIEDEGNLRQDIRDTLKRLIPPDAPYRHPINAYSHIISMFLPPDRTLPLVDGQLVLGTWQSLVFIEADTHARTRRIIVQVVGE
ncbi:MAG TPA: YjbQ family protein [Candidatus Bathyarchaeota archaeon]|nr:YjbQ family protein [Candidatus Bathyarchaeota archaeon]